METAAEWQKEKFCFFCQPKEYAECVSFQTVCSIALALLKPGAESGIDTDPTESAKDARGPHMMFW